MKISTVRGRSSTFPSMLLLLACCACSVSAFYHVHKLMAAALLANSFQRNPILPLPIPIPIPVKAGGNTIIAMSPDEYADGNAVHSSCPHCFQGRRIDAW